MFFHHVLLAVVLLAVVNAQTSTCPKKCQYRMNNLNKRIKTLESAVANGGGTASSGPGAVFTRWGRTTCPENNAMLYEGVAAGSFYSHAGGGANYLCLPNEPQFANVHTGAQACGAAIYGAEYEICSKDILGKDNTLASDLHQNDVPCAVCQSTNRQSFVNIPARTECPAGWRLEYQGYVMASHRAHRRTEWVCMDAAPETRSNGHENRDGALFYLAEVMCGVLPCPPYESGREIPCVICTK